MSMTHRENLLPPQLTDLVGHLSGLGFKEKRWEKKEYAVDSNYSFANQTINRNYKNLSPDKISPSIEV